MFLRIDDIGACSKEYEYYGKTSFNFLNKNWPLPELFTNFLFMKKFPLWSGWARYSELSVNEWESILDFLSKNKLILNVAITACWVNKENKLIRFDKKFPLQTKIIQEGQSKNLIYILNHGLTHCIPGRHMPMRFRSNQKYHREFSIIHIHNKNVDVFHDKDIVINGLDYFRSINNFSKNRYYSMKKLID